MVADHSTVQEALSAPRLDAYLARIGYTGPRDASVDVLHGLHAAHVSSIPFEAIDVLMNRGISLEPGVIFDKLVSRRRGGYCYEQNGLFRSGAAALGFPVQPRMGRVLWGGVGNSDFQPRTHMALIVEAGGEQWLTDVGFGSAVPTQPLRWNSEAAQDSAHGRYRLVATTYGRRLEIDTGGAAWQALYEIMDEVPQAEDFEVGNWFTSTHPASPFAEHLIVTRVDAAGRLILYETELTIRLSDGTTRRESLPLRDIESVLQEMFGLSVDLELRTVLEKIASRS